jgi:hypothetical protein
MGIRLYKRPKLKNTTLIAGWPGIGNVGLMAIDTLRQAVKAEELGEIEPWDLFYPKRIIVKDGILEDIEFPINRFYFRKTEQQDLLIFIGEEQPSRGGRFYAEGKEAYQIANMVLDVALKFGCQRVYTSGAAVAPIHHAMRPRVWAVPNSANLIAEIKGYNNTILMSDIEGREGQGNITGLNGLLLGVARKRGLEAICLMGEVPVYLQGLPLSYPKASKSVLEVLATCLGILIDTGEINGFVERREQEIEKIYERFPSEMREQLDKLKYATYAKPTESAPITEEDKKRILENIDKFFKKEPKED